MTKADVLGKAYAVVDVESPGEDIEALQEPPPPQQWQLIAKGSGQFEYQGFEAWTDEEQDLWKQGKLKCKWGVGQVSIRLPIQDVWQLLALVYGFLPFLVPVWWSFWSLTTYIRIGRPRFFPFFGICITVCFALVNELIVKQICKRVLSSTLTARPREAVCKHPGMPSGHTLIAYTLLVWILLEVLFSKFLHPEWLLIILVVMAPVPWARVRNKDHTVFQVLVAICCGIAMGILACYIRRECFPDHHMLWDWYAAGSGFDMN